MSIFYFFCIFLKDEYSSHISLKKEKLEVQTPKKGLQDKVTYSALPRDITT